jgi:hypothetical protein
MLACWTSGGGLVGNLCLRGKVGRVGGGALMKLRLVSPVIVPESKGLGVAPDDRKDERFVCQHGSPGNEILPGLGLVLALFRVLTTTWRLLGGWREKSGNSIIRLGWGSSQRDRLVEVFSGLRLGLCSRSRSWRL